MAHSVRGLSPGVYYYDPQAHALRERGAGSENAGLVRALGLSERCSSQATVVVGATFARTAHRYRQRAYRYVLLDVGHVLLNMHVVLSALGIPHLVTLRFFDDELSSEVGLDSSRQGPVAGILLGPGQDSYETTFTLGVSSMPQRYTGGDLAIFLHGLTSWVRGRDVVFERVAKVLTAPVWMSTRDVFGVIADRRSVRDYGSRPLGLDEVRNVAEAALHALDLVDACSLVEVLLAARHVRGLLRGVYRVRCPTLAREASISWPRLFSASLSQEVVGQASAVVALVGRLDTLGRLDADRDIRRALVAAGAAGEAVYLAATDQGLAACGVGAYYDDETDLALGLAPRHETTLYLVALGPKE